jgi:hypothetical protein
MTAWPRVRIEGVRGIKSPQLHPLDLVSDLVRSSFLGPQPSSLAGAFGMVGRNLGDHRPAVG